MTLQLSYISNSDGDYHMNRKKIVKEIIKIVAFLFLVSFTLVILNRLLIRKDEYNKYDQFYDEKENFDVLFFGSSRMLDCIQPMEIWEEYGITSYNMAQHSEGLGRSYYSMMNAFKYNKPKVAVIDVSLFYGSIGLSEDASESDKAYLHNTLDHMPLSRVKLKAINELLPKSLRFEYVFTLAKYHSRWNDLNQNDIYNISVARKGAEVRVGISPQERIDWPTDALAEIFIPESINLDKMIELCEEEGVVPVFICLPSPEDTAFTSFNSFADYLAKNDQIFLNIYKEEDILEYQTDFADSSHLNVSGSLKISDYMGEYLCENFVFEEKSDSTKANWDNALKDYWATKNVLIISKSDDFNTVMSLIESDDDYEYTVQTDGKKLTVTNVHTNELLIDKEY